jgi:two-component system, OmpR family, sensor kinase
MHTIARTVARAPLRARLTALSVLLVALGLAGAGVATHYALRAFLIDRVDQEFAPAEGPALHWVSDGDAGARRCVENALPLQSFVAAVPPGDDRVQNGLFHGHGKVTDDLRELAEHAPLGYSSADGYRLRTVPAAQVAASLGGAPVCGRHPGPPPPGGKIVIAISTAGVSSTVGRLDRLELMIGLIVVVIAGALAWALVRVELRPLRRIEDTAAAIAAGDLSQRVDVGAPGTEVGHLGESLNAMLVQIERAFDERRASESRLRRFVADAGHELRTPLTSVRGYAELYRRGGAGRPADLAMIMARIESEAERMGVLVDDLLLLANLDQGRPLERHPVELSRLVTEMATDQRMLHSDWPVQLRVAPDIEVVGDELRLRQAVGNLLANTRAHTPPGTRIVISVSVRDGMAAIEVADDGPGVPADVMGRVFERFFRADPSRSRASGGSGLGLSIVAAIAEAHGGGVEVESPAVGGAVFRILLPLHVR